MQYAMRNGNAELLRLPEVEFIDDKEGKPVAINAAIGRRQAAGSMGRGSTGGSSRT